MGKFRRRTFCRKGGELNFEDFIFVHMPTTRNFYRAYRIKGALVLKIIVNARLL